MGMPRMVKAAVVAGRLIGGGGLTRVPLVHEREVVGYVAPDGTVEFEYGTPVEADEAMRKGLVDKLYIDGRLHSVVVPTSRREI